MKAKKPKLSVIQGGGQTKPIPMIMQCPQCGERHIDEGEFAKRSHRTHCCQECGFVWRPAIVPTVGVQFLPGYRDEDSGSDSAS